MLRREGSEESWNDCDVEVPLQRMPNYNQMSTGCTEKRKNSLNFSHFGIFKFVKCCGWL